MINWYCKTPNQWLLEPIHSYWRSQPMGPWILIVVQYGIYWFYLVIYIYVCELIGLKTLFNSINNQFKLWPMYLENYNPQGNFNFNVIIFLFFYIYCDIFRCFWETVKIDENTHFDLLIVPLTIFIL